MTHAGPDIDRTSQHNLFALSYLPSQTPLYPAGRPQLCLGFRNGEFMHVRPDVYERSRHS